MTSDIKEVLNKQSSNSDVKFNISKSIALSFSDSKNFDCSVQKTSSMDSGNLTCNNGTLSTSMMKNFPKIAAMRDSLEFKLGVKQTKPTKICGVCGDKALGYNFDAISCESCKAFFRRNAPKGVEAFKCPNVNLSPKDDCKMDVFNRRFCKQCRLKKCFSIGMRKEYILSENEKNLKRIKVERNKANRKLNNIQKPPSRKQKSSTPQISVEGLSLNHVVKLSDDDVKLLTNLQKSFCSSTKLHKLSEDDVKNISSMVDIINISEICIRRIIDMSKRIPSFKSLSQEDQVVLLKGGSTELSLLRGVLSYDIEKGIFKDEDDNKDSPIINAELLMHLEPHLFTQYITFIKSLIIDIGADKFIILLLFMITLFNPDRLGISNTVSVEKEQMKYTMSLRNYVDILYPPDLTEQVFSSLLMKLSDLRVIADAQIRILLSLPQRDLNPLMKEVLDIENLENSYNLLGNVPLPDVSVRNRYFKRISFHPIRTQDGNIFNDSCGVQELSPSVENTINNDNKTPTFEKVQNPQHGNFYMDQNMYNISINQDPSTF